MPEEFSVVKLRALVVLFLWACCSSLLAGEDLEINHEELQLKWEELLGFALSGTEDSRRSVEEVQGADEGPALKKLADFLLFEWTVPKTDFS